MTNRKSFPHVFLALAFMTLFAGCASTPVSKERPLVFYPALPESPRVQYLASFSSAADLGPQRAGFAEFVAGKDPKEKLAVKKPYGVVVWDGKIIVVDSNGPGYAVFDLKSRKIKGVSGTGPGKMKKPINIAVDKDGTRFVSDTALNQVLVFDANDNFLRAFGVKDQFRPSGVAVAGDRLYVSDLKNHEIHVLDKRSGTTLFKFGKAGSKEAEFFFPTNIVVAPDNHLYITNTGNFRVQKFTLDGQFVRSYGEIGDRPGQFARPKGVAVDKDGNIYTVDAAFENVQAFDKEGRLLLFFGGPGGNPEDINLPTVVHINYEDAPVFQQYADPRFKLEYVIVVASQFGNSKVNVYGFGKMEGMDYSVKEPVVGEKN
jgi:sugar lactone lactonase YvrE